MVSVAINLRDNATPAVERLMNKVQPRQVGAVIMPACREFWRDRLRSDIYQGSSSGTTGTKREAWARSVVGSVNDDGILLGAGDDKAAIGLRQRYYGGQIPRGGPKSGPSGKFLAIPISPQSNGKVPADFPNCFFIKGKNGKGYLVDGGKHVKKAGKRNASGGQSLVFLFLIIGSVNQEKNPLVVPTNDEFSEICLARIVQSIKEN